MSDAEALSLVERQAGDGPLELGPNAPRSNIELLERLRLAREHGYAWVEESSAVGTSAIAAVVRRPHRWASGWRAERCRSECANAGGTTSGVGSAVAAVCRGVVCGEPGVRVV